VNRGEIWLAQVGRKSRPVLVMTRPEVIEVRELITIIEITTKTRGIGAEVAFDHVEAGLNEPSTINCDGIHTVARSQLTRRVGVVDAVTMKRVCRAVSYAVGC
jgi:mRNA-degrading endonuclease toxin of MazEF toxin-antitoxin module